MTINFSPGSEQAQQRALARAMPEGKVWENKFDLNTNLGKLILGLSSEYFRLSVLIEEISTEVDINQTEQLITDWQQSVGIPDDCFSADGTLEEKRRNVLLKLTKYGGIQKASDFEDLAQALGFVARVTNGVAHGIFPLTFPVRFFDSRKTAVHTIIVDLEEQQEVFPLEFPIQFTTTVSGILECLFKKLRPSNCQILFTYGVSI